MFDKNIFADRLHSLRTNVNINQKTLAENIGVSYHAISKIENKQRAASIEVIYSIADYFNVSLDYLTGKSDNPTPTIIDSCRLNISKDEEELLNDYRLLDKYEKRIVKGKISEFLYNKEIERNSPKNESSDELLDVNFKDRVNK